MKLSYVLVHVCAVKHRLTEQFQFQQSSLADKDLYSWNYNKCENVCVALTISMFSGDTGTQTIKEYKMWR
jgi:hypothetical protein